MYMILDGYRCDPTGLLQTVKKLRRNQNIVYVRIYRIIQDNNLMTSPSTESRSICVNYHSLYLIHQFFLSII